MEEKNHQSIQMYILGTPQCRPSQLSRLKTQNPEEAGENVSSREGAYGYCIAGEVVSIKGFSSASCIRPFTAIFTAVWQV